MSPLLTLTLRELLTPFCIKKNFARLLSYGIRGALMPRGNLSAIDRQLVDSQEVNFMSTQPQHTR